MPTGLPTTSINQLDTLTERYRKCTACSLHSKRPRYFHGRGNKNAEIVVLTDKPTAADIDSGIILSSPHSKILTTMLQPYNIELCDLWLTTTVVCAPEDAKDPKIGEIKACRQRLCEEIHLVNPRVILGFGTLAIKALFPKKPPSLIEVAGRAVDAYIQGDIVEYPIPAIITYSLSHLLRNQDTTPGGLWNKFYDHVQRAVLLAQDLSRYETK